MAYIANKPVRFDRDYRIGEVIPEDVIAPGMKRKLTEMGKILRVDLPQESGAGDAPEQPQGGAESAPGGDPGAGEVITQPEGEPPQGGAESGAEGAGNAAPGEGADAPAGGEFVCETCGRAFTSQQALAAHSRSHKD